MYINYGLLSCIIIATFFRLFWTGSNCSIYFIFSWNILIRLFPIKHFTYNSIATNMGISAWNFLIIVVITIINTYYYEIKFLQTHTVNSWQFILYNKQHKALHFHKFYRTWILLYVTERNIFIYSILNENIFDIFCFLLNSEILSFWSKLTSYISDESGFSWLTITKVD